MPGVAALLLLAVNAIVLIGLPVVAFVVMRRAWGKKTSTSAIGATLSALLVCPLLLPTMSYAYRDHLCSSAGGWTFSVPENATVMRSADQGVSIDFSKYQLRSTSERRGLWVHEIKLQIETRQSSAPFAMRTEFFSDFTYASGWLWLGRPDSKICNEKSWTSNLAYEHFASRLPR
jgi:hypothetical protein